MGSAKHNISPALTVGLALPTITLGRMWFDEVCAEGNGLIISFEVYRESVRVLWRGGAMALLGGHVFVSSKNGDRTPFIIFKQHYINEFDYK